MHQHATERAGGAVASSRKCGACGLINFASAETCRRCKSTLDEQPGVDPAPTTVGSRREQSVARRLLWLAVTTLVLVFLWSRSLLLTSEPIDARQQQVVQQAIAILEHSGFSREALMLRHFANFRATDNWLNNALGHRDAYAATNFPLGVLTVYPKFFTVAVDDTERAAILLHEAQHLLGAGETAALERTWRGKQQLGWTADRYADTRVWKNTREYTAADVPALFACGPDGHSDCVH